MAERDIEIPFGPDKTNGEGFSPIVPEGAQTSVSETLAGLPVIGETPNEAPSTDSGSYDTASPEVPPVAVETYPAAEVPVEDFVQNVKDRGSDDYVPEGMSEEEATAQGLDDVQLSFAALKDSIEQSRELKVREKEHEQLAAQLKTDREELADRDDILANYHTLVAEQDAIMAENGQQRENLRAQANEIDVQIAQLEDELERMRDYHNAQLEPFEMALGRARASADQAKNDERSRKTELNAAETELRRAEGDDSRALETAKLEQVQAAYDEARTRSEKAKEALDQAQKAYDDARDQAEQAEAPLERNIADLNQRLAETKETITQLGDIISDARKRRQYCDNVYQYPEETEKLRREIDDAAGVEMQMISENKALRERLAKSKAQSLKAKIAIGIIIVIIIVIIVAFVFAGIRAS